jgi:hypothetical protein
MSERVAPPRPEGCDVLHDDRDGVVVFCDPDAPDNRWIACDPDLTVVARP